MGKIKNPVEIELVTTRIEKTKSCPLLCEQITLLHGTSRARAEKILSEGFKSSAELEREMLEGWSSQGYEGGLSFFGKNTLNGNKLASRHAYRVASEEFFKSHPDKNFENITNEDAEEINDNAVLVEASACVCNYLQDKDINHKFIDELVHTAKDRSKLEGEMYNYDRETPLFRFTYARLDEDDWAFNVIGQGVRADYGISMADIMTELGMDAIEGFEHAKKNECSSVVLNNPKKSIIKMKIVEPAGKEWAYPTGERLKKLQVESKAREY